MSRRWLILGSLLAHACLGVGIFITGVWRIDRLHHRRPASIGLGVLLPPGLPAEGGQAAAAAPKLEPKLKKRIVRDTQPAPISRETSVASHEDVRPTEVGDGTGTGPGEGLGRGSGLDVPGGLPCAPGTTCGGGGDQDLAAAVCGNRIVEPGESCDDGNRATGDGCSAMCAVEPAPVALVPPNLFVGMRISGETQIYPPDPVKTTMIRDGKQRAVGAVKVCIDRAGQVASVAIAASTTYPAYDAQLVAATRHWRYRPYAVNGVPAPACSVVTFIYAIR